MEIINESGEVLKILIYKPALPVEVIFLNNHSFYICNNVLEWNIKNMNNEGSMKLNGNRPMAEHIVYIIFNLQCVKELLKPFTEKKLNQWVEAYGPVSTKDRERYKQILKSSLSSRANKIYRDITSMNILYSFPNHLRRLLGDEAIIH
jgi:hypothetical protein